MNDIHQLATSCARPQRAINSMWKSDNCARKNETGGCVKCGKKVINFIEEKTKQ